MLLISDIVEYEELGAMASDNLDGMITGVIEITGTVDTEKQRIYQIYYNVADKAGNEAVEVIEVVHVIPLNECILELDVPPVEVYANSVIGINKGRASIQLSTDLPVVRLYK